MLDELPLSEIFLRRWPGSGDGHRQDGPALAQKLLELYEQGQAHWAGVQLLTADFVTYLAARAPVGAPPEASLAVVRASDLYLACACVQGVSAALDQFDRIILAQVPSFIFRIDSSAAFADDVCQVLRERLLCPAAGAEPGIARYSGTGELLSWVRVVAVRTALGLRRNLDERPALSVDETVLQAIPSGGSPEQENIRAHCQAEFKAALTEAFHSLSREQRNILRLHFASGLTGAQIASLLSIGRATVVRWLARVREQLLRETRRRLRLRLQLDQAELDSFITAALSQFDMSLTSLLREHPVGDASDDQS